MPARSSRWTLLEVLDWTRAHFEQRGLPSARLDAEVLLAHVLRTERVMLYARFDQPLGPEERASMRALVHRRALGVPVAHLVGQKEFWSLSIEVNADVLIPRPETELLVEVGRRRAASATRVVDVGTGSGAVALALAKEMPRARIWGLELTQPASEVARRNAERLGLDARVHIVESDLLQKLPEDARPVELVTANLPYVRTADLEGLDPGVRDFEPRTALDGGPDGLSLIRRLLGEAPPVLAEGALLALEADPSQMPLLTDLLERGGFSDIESTTDLSRRPRIVSGRWAHP